MITNFSVFSWPRPLGAQYAGEVHNLFSDIPGRSTRMTDFASMTIQYFSDDVFHNTCGSITLFRHVDSSRWQADAPIV